MLLFRVFSIPVRFFIALLIYFSWGPLAGGVVTAPVPEFSSPALIPYPSKVVRGAGEAGFRSVHVKVGPDVPGRDDLMREIKDIFRTSGIQGSLNSGRAAEGAMTWELFPDARMKGEGYDLSVGLGKATVRAGSFGGFFNALQTLRQLVFNREGEFAMPVVRISDKPAFVLRGINYGNILLTEDAVVLCEVKTYTSGSSIGGIAGSNLGTIANSGIKDIESNSAVVRDTKIGFAGTNANYANIGGAAGVNDGSINRCNISADITGDLGTTDTGYGGIAGVNNSSISKCAYSGNLLTNGSADNIVNLGGIAGRRFPL